MTSNNRGRLGEFVIGNGSKQSDAANLSMPPPIGSTYSSNNWNSRNIWGSTIGSGLKPNANELGRQPNKASFGNGDIIPIQMGGVFEPSEEITGSGSLLSTSESEGFARRASLQWPAMAGGLNGVNGGLNGVNGGLNGMAGPQHNHRSASPGRPRTNQHTRSNSPFSNGQIPSMGASNGKASSTAFDPRSRSFNPSAVPFSNSGYDGLLISGRSDDPGRRQQQGMTYGGMGGFGNQAYSGYASSAASRSGSLPPSRHGNEPGAQLGDLTLNSLQANGTDVFSHRSNQHSRNNFSTPALNRLGDTTWGPPIGDLAVDVDRLDLDGETTAPYMSSQGMPPSPGSVNGAFNSFSFSRNGSVSYDPEARGSQQNLNQYRMGYGERPTHSPSDSEHRRSHDSPVYYSATPPMLDQYNRGSSGASSRLNMTGSNYNSATLDRKLRHVYEQQMHAGHSNPSSSFRQPYYNGFDGTPQAVARMNPTMQYYNGVPGGYQPHHGPTGRPAPRGPAVDTTPQPLRSPLLEEFRSSKGSKRYELKDIYGHVVEFSGDQHGSRFIQQKLETANSDEKAQLFSEILPNARQLMTDVFGNYVIQKFFEHGNQTQKKQLADMMKGYITLLSLQMYGCRVVQKAFEHILVDQQALLVQELESGVLKCVKDQNGNHVVQKAIERIPAEHIGFIIDAFTGQVQILATHPYGCRVVQRLLEHCPEPARSSILEELHACALALIVDQYGNYVAQHVIEHGRPEDKLKLITLTLNQLVTYSKHKFASNVVERCIRFGSDDDRRTIVDKITALDANGNSPLHSLMQHEYGNYVIQKLLKTLNGEEYNRFVDILRPCLTRARQFSYGKQIGQIDKLVDSLKTNKRSSPASSQRTSLALPSEKSSTPTPPPLTEDTNSPPSSSQPSTNASTVDGPASTPKADDSAEKKDLATPTFEVKADGDDATTVATPKPAFLES